ncbi:50S ribosomal protein L32e [Candidatus Bathyarchaeota archaeon]|nr:50S ribosomal protein L32e [Candidatus Bathyarchaeota archaeon]
MSEQDSAAIKKALQLRARVKRKKPNFVRQESWRYDRLKENWRKPKGIDNKMRRKIKGWPATVNVGYRGPKAARGLHPSGYMEVLVHNIEELKKIDPKTQAARIAHTVSKKLRAEIIREANKKKIIILNLGEAKEKISEKKEEAAEEKAEEVEKAEESKEAKEKAEKEPEEKKKPRERRKKTEEISGRKEEQ